MKCSRVVTDAVISVDEVVVSWTECDERTLFVGDDAAVEEDFTSM